VISEGAGGRVFVGFSTLVSRFKQSLSSVLKCNVGEKGGSSN
jgi:hypothetical protein